MEWNRTKVDKLPHPFTYQVGPMQCNMGGIGVCSLCDKIIKKDRQNELVNE